MTGRMRGLMRAGLALCVLMAMLLSACATARGFGQDLEPLGRTIEPSGK